MNRDAGTYRQVRATWSREQLTSPAAVAYAIGSAAEDLAAGAARHHEAPDWSRLRIELHPDGTSLALTLAAWCDPDGTRDEYAIPTYNDPVTADTDAADMTFEGFHVEEAEWVRTVGPWRPTGFDATHLLEEAQR